MFEVDVKNVTEEGRGGEEGRGPARVLYADVSCMAKSLPNHLLRVCTMYITVKKTEGLSIKTNPKGGHKGILTVPYSVVRAR